VPGHPAAENVEPDRQSSIPGVAFLLLACAVIAIPSMAPQWAMPSFSVGYTGTGHEIFAKWMAMLFYPFTLLHLLAPHPIYFDLFHSAVAASGVYLVVARWTGNGWPGMTLSVLVVPFAASGFPSPNAMAALAWTPWLLFLAEAAFARGGRELVLCGALAAIQLLSGSIEVSALTWICMAISAGSVFVRQALGGWLRMKRFGAFALLAFLLAATQVVPLMDALPSWEAPPGNIDVDVEHLHRPVLVQRACWRA
jgi:hypothetical protein